LRTGANDLLYSYSYSSRDIVSSNTTTGAASDQKVIASNLGALADYTITQNGRVYFLDASTAPFGMTDSPGQPRIALRSISRPDELPAPRALALSPDQSMLVVTDADSRYSWSFQIAADGTLVDGEPFYRLELPETTMLSWQSGTRGVIEDANGEVYFATPLGIQVSMQNGRIAEILNPPIPGGGPLTAITFAENGDQSWLYAAQDGKLYRRPVKVTGANAWTVVKPPKPTL
jgi:sugar lactone lactonase YvrE